MYATARKWLASSRLHRSIRSLLMNFWSYLSFIPSFSLLCYYIPGQIWLSVPFGCTWCPSICRHLIDLAPSSSVWTDLNTVSDTRCYQLLFCPNGCNVHFKSIQSIHLVRPGRGWGCGHVKMHCKPACTYQAVHFLCLDSFSPQLTPA